MEGEFEPGRQRDWFTPGILPFALRASVTLYKIAPGDFVSLHAEVMVEVH